MRLLNVHSLTLRVCHHDIPKYVTASHRWAQDGEATLEDVQEQRNTQKPGYRKVEGFAKYVREHIPHVDYLWIDTCCIKKESSQEVLEAINSMFKWYSNTELCLAYLADVKTNGDLRGFSQSDWFSRGWTLQELLAPQLVIFLSQDWEVIGHKGGTEQSRSGVQLRAGPSLEVVIANVTRIQEPVLRDYSQSQEFTLSQMFDWMEGRKTTREEDMSYCLLGLFNVSMYANYGEGAKHARTRLLRKIHKSARLAGQQPDASMTNMTLHHKEGVLMPSSRVVSQLETNDTANYRIPFDPNGVPATDDFVQREDDMRQLEDFFQHKSEPSRRSVFVVHGLGGVGKTQLCVEFVRKHMDDFSAIFWLDGSSKDALRQTLAEAALKLPPTLPYSPHENIDAQISLVLHWLSLPNNTDWLLVLNNIDSDRKSISEDSQEYGFERFLPLANHGNILITSRVTRLRGTIVHLHLQSVDDCLGREILETQAGKHLPNTESLLEKLGGLPLALVQAGAYLRETNINTQDYLKFYNETWERLTTDQGQFTLCEYAERRVLTTWKMAYERVSMVNKRATRLLDLWAFLHPGDIWYELAASSADANGANEDIMTIAEDELSFRQSLRILSQYALIQGNVDRGSLSVHPVLHDWCLQNIASIEERQRVCSHALFLVAKFVSSSIKNNHWSVARRLVPHARVTAVRHLALPTSRILSETLHKTADFLGDWESSIEVEGLYLRVLDVTEGASDTESILSAVNNLGLLYATQGKLAQAEQMYMRALNGREKTRGPEHTSTLDVVNDLGLLYAHQGKLTQAEEMYLRELRGREKTWGLEHTSTLDAAHNLGLLYKIEGKLAHAEDMYMRALKGREKTWGQDHTSTLDTVHRLGILYKTQGKLMQAEAMYMRALKGREKVLGPGHMSTLDTVHRLGILYKTQGKLAQAEAMYLRALKGRENVLGLEHTSTLATIHDLGSLYKIQGNLVRAEVMYTRALKGRENAWGTEHTSTLSTLHDLGSIYKSQGKLAQAEEMYMRALKGKESAWGPEHTSTLSTAHNLGSLYAYQGELALAEDMYMRALQGFEKAWGAEHTSTLSTVRNLSNLYTEQGKLAQAEEMHMRALKGTRAPRAIMKLICWLFGRD